MSSKAPTYNRSAFFDDIIQYLRAELPPELREFKVRQTSYLVKLFYGNERVHFEVWVDPVRAQIEIGLDFEDGAESTAAYLSFFDQRIVEIKELTGPDLELERWTRTWGHFVEVYPIAPIDRERARTIAERMVVFMSVLQPLIEEAAVPPSDWTPSNRPYWRRRNRRG
ncbi:MAG: hypothetical protein KC438_01650 [Thermomicrobiales bacterium]|nr:hypothetical protein [Thermomicrobiales bacterium]MCO5222863.1 hypothetical protein [Thermomicrobiales bacterium]